MKKEKEKVMTELKKMISFGYGRFSVDFTSRIDLISNEMMKELSKINILQIVRGAYNTKNWRLIFPFMMEADFEYMNFSVGANYDGSILQEIAHVRYQNLLILNVEVNNLSNCEPLARMQCQNLQQLRLAHNRITHIQSLRKLTTKSLLSLEIQGNFISSYSHFTSINTHFLEKLSLQQYTQNIIRRDSHHLMCQNIASIQKMENSRLIHFHLVIDYMKVDQVQIRPKQSNQIAEDNEKPVFHDSEGCLKRFLLLHTLEYLIKLKEIIKKNKEQYKTSIKNSDFFEIRQHDRAQYLVVKMSENLEEALEGKRINELLTKSDLFLIFWKEMKTQGIPATIMFTMELLCSFLFVKALQSLFASVQSDEIEKAYIYVGIITVIQVSVILFRQNGQFYLSMGEIRFKAALISLLYEKISSLPAFVMERYEIGKVINMISNDLMLVESKLPSLVYGILSPITFLGVISIMIVQLGLLGIFGTLVPTIMLPLIIYINKINGQTTMEIYKLKDKRVQTMNEIISGLKCIKKYGWEEKIKLKISKIREEEISLYYRLAIGKTIGSVISNCLSGWTIFLIFVIYARTNNSSMIDVSLIFSTIQLMGFFKKQLLNFSVGIGFYYEMNVAFERFLSILNIKDIALESLEFQTMQEDLQRRRSDQTLLIQSSLRQKRKRKIVLEHFNGYLANFFKEIKKQNLPQFDHLHLLKDISVELIRGNIYNIAGVTGSKKSSFLKIFIKELPFYTGLCEKEPTIKTTYIAEPYVFFHGSTLKENIILSEQYDELHYEFLLDILNLDKQFSMFQEGDQMIYNDRSLTVLKKDVLNLIGIARGLYKKSDLYLIDDVLTSLPENIMQNICKYLQHIKNTSIILIISNCNSKNLPLNWDSMLIFQNGKIVDIIEESKISANILTNNSSVTHLESLNTNGFVQKMKRSQASNSRSRRSRSRSKSVKSKLIKISTPSEKHEPIDLNLKSFTGYFFLRNMNKLIIPLALVVFLVSELSNNMFFTDIGNQQNIVNNSLAGNGTANSTSTNQTFFAMRSTLDMQDSFNKVHSNNHQNRVFEAAISNFWLYLGVLQVLFTILCLLRSLFAYIAIIKSNEKVHIQLLDSLLKISSNFENKSNTTTTTDLLTKYSNDMSILDTVIAASIIDVSDRAALILIFMMSFFNINKVFIPIAIGMIGFYVILYAYTFQVIIQTKKVDLKNKGIVFQHFRQSASNLIEISLAHEKKFFIRKCSDAININTKSHFSFIVINRGFLLIGAYIIQACLTTALLIGVYTLNPDNRSLFTVSVSALLTISESVSALLSGFLSVSGQMVSFERAKKIIDLEGEKQYRNAYDEKAGLIYELIADSNSDSKKRIVHEEWPDQATFSISNLNIKYKENSPLVLKNIAFDVKNKQKVAILGKRGSGKSTLVEALLRTIQPNFDCKYEFGGFDAKRLGLYSLRQHISVVSQDLFIMKGTIKQNIDPFEERTDLEIWNILEQCTLKKFIKNLPDQLETQISVTSNVLSAGQRQLLCFARALIEKNKCILIDSALSKIDAQTQKHIVQLLLENSKSKTVIMLTDSPNLAKHYQKIIVLQDGEIVETGTAEQLQSKGGSYYEMIEDLKARNY